MLQGSVVGRRLPILNIQHGAQPTDSIGMPVAAWILGECLLRWASLWKATEVGWPGCDASCLPALVHDDVHEHMLV